MNKTHDEIQRRVSAIKMDMMIKQHEQHGYVFCQACGCSSGFQSLDASHLVPRSYSKALQDDPKNIWLHCRTWNGRGCHRRWERNDSTMPKYDAMMKIVRDICPEYYNLRINKTKRS